MRWWLQADAVAENLFRESLALAREAGDKVMEARSARDLSWALCDQERYAEATELAEASEALCEQIGDRSEGAWVRLVFGRLAQCYGDWEQVMRDWSEAVTTHEADRLLVCEGLYLMGEASFIRGTLEEAWSYAERSRSVAEEIDSRDQTAGALLVLGTVAARQGRLLEACSYLEQATDLREEIGDSLRAAVCQAQLGYVLARRGRFEAAWIQLVRALRFSQSRHHPQQAKEAVCCIGQASVHAGCLQHGAELLGLASRLPPGWCHLEVRVEPEMALLREALGDEELEAALARGAKLDLDQVIAQILSCETPEAYWGIGTDEIRDRAGEAKPQSAVGASRSARDHRPPHG
jgi:tetratricopeptide (TPR) repeat protein